MTEPILPSVIDPIGRGIDALVQTRPSAARHVERGRYGHPFAGWRAQEAILLARIACEETRGDGRHWRTTMHARAPGFGQRVATLLLALAQTTAGPRRKE